MDRLGGHFLAGSAFAGDEDRGPGLRHAFDRLIDGAHRRRCADETVKLLAVVFAPHLLHRPGHGGEFGGIADRGQQALGFDRLDEEIIGAQPGRLNGPVDRSVRRDHDDLGDFGDGGHAGEQFQPVAIGQLQVEQDHIEGDARHDQRAHGGPCIGHMCLMARGLQLPGIGQGQGRRILDNQYPAYRHDRVT
jgi:hypothetical protein